MGGVGSAAAVVTGVVAAGGVVEPGVVCAEDDCCMKGFMNPGGRRLGLNAGVAVEKRR